MDDEPKLLPSTRRTNISKEKEGRFRLPGPDDIPWYFCCSTCDAKFFNDVSKCECPRCGSELTSNERIQPPWQKKLLTIKEASKVLSISRSKLYQMVERKEVCHRRIGAAIRFSEHDITEILESSKREREEPVSRKQKPSRQRLKHVRL